MNPPLLIIGAGGHGRVVADALLAAGQNVLGFVDPASSLWGRTCVGLPVLGGEAVLEDDAFRSASLVNGLGGTGGALRRRAQRRLEAAGREFVGVRHPSAVVSPFARLAGDVQILARAVIQADAEVRGGCIINTAAVVEHDCRLSTFVHCAPGSVLCGGVTVGDDGHIGAASVIRQNVTLGRGVVVGAGAVVVADCTEEGALLVGSPARTRV